MAHKTLIGGTAYEISGGKTLVNGAAYEIGGGKTLVNGTAYDIPFSTFVPVYDIGNVTVSNYNSEYGYNTTFAMSNLPSGAEKCNRIVIDGVEYEIERIGYWEGEEIWYRPLGYPNDKCPLNFFSFIIFINRIQIGFDSQGTYNVQIGYAE